MQYTAVANTWVSPFVYYTLINKLSVWAPDPPVVLLSGVVDKEAGSAELRSAYRFDSESDVDLGTTGDLGIVFRGVGDVELASAGFDPSLQVQAGAGLFRIERGPAPRPSRCACPGSMALRRSSSFVAAPLSPRGSYPRMRPR